MTIYLVKNTPVFKPLIEFLRNQHFSIWGQALVVNDRPQFYL